MVNSTILSSTKHIRGFSFQLKKPKTQKSISLASQRIRRGFSFVVEQWKITFFTESVTRLILNLNSQLGGFTNELGIQYWQEDSWFQFCQEQKAIMKMTIIINFLYSYQPINKCRNPSVKSTPNQSCIRQQILRMLERKYKIDPNQKVLGIKNQYESKDHHRQIDKKIQEMKVSLYCILSRFQQHGISIWSNWPPHYLYKERANAQIIKLLILLIQIIDIFIRWRMQEFKILQELIRSLKKPFEKRSEDDLYPIERMVRKIEFFQKYFADQNDLNFSYYFEHEYAIQNTAIINIDSVGDKFYVILQGQVGIYVKPNVVEDKASSTKLLEMVKLRFRQAVNNNKFKDYQINKIQSQQSDLVLIKILLPGQSFGEMSLIHNRPRDFTAVALQPCHFALIRRQYFKDVVRIGQEKSSVKEMGFFANLEIFEGWNVNSIYQIYKMLEQRCYRMGDVVYSSGESASKIYLLKEGAVDLQQVFIEEKEELEIRSVSPYMKQRGKSLHRKIATLSNHQFLGLDDVHSQEQKHRFSCVSSSSDTILFIIPLELYMRKIYTQPTSQLYVQEFIQVQSKYQDLRNSQLQVAINSQRQQQQQMMAKINQYKNADMLQFFQNLQGRFKTLSQESAKKFQKSSIGERSQNISAHDKYVDRSCFTRAKDRSLLGKVQTQSLYQNQAYKQVINESRIVEKNLPNLSQFLERHLPSLHHSKSMQVRCRRQSPQKQQYLQFQNVQTSLNEDEQQLVSNILSKGVVYQRRPNLVKRVKSTETYSQRRAIRFQDQTKL